jgi:hypothetical protein
MSGGKSDYTGSIGTLSLVLLSVLYVALSAGAEQLERSEQVFTARHAYGLWYVHQTLAASANCQRHWRPCEDTLDRPEPKSPPARPSLVGSIEAVDDRAIPDGTPPQPAAIDPRRSLRDYVQSSTDCGAPIISSIAGNLRAPSGSMLVDPAEGDRIPPSPLPSVPPASVSPAPWISPGPLPSVPPALMDVDDRPTDVCLEGAINDSDTGEVNIKYSMRSLTYEVRVFRPHDSDVAWSTSGTLITEAGVHFDPTMSPTAIARTLQALQHRANAELLAVSDAFFGNRAQLSPDPEKVPFSTRFGLLHRSLLANKSKIPVADIDVSSEVFLWALLMMTSSILIVMRNRVRYALREKMGEPWLLVDSARGLERCISNIWLLCIVAAPWLVGAAALVGMTTQIYVDGSVSTLAGDLTSFGSLVALMSIGAYVSLQVAAQLLRFRHLRELNEEDREAVQ